MLISDEKLLDYFLHRVGEKRLTSSPWIYRQRALEGNVQGVPFLETFGKSTIRAYVGFIDLAGFSTRVQGQSPQEIENYLFPFLEKIINILDDDRTLVDKMIGDEIMFVLPEIEEIGTFESILLLGQILGGLHDLAYEMASKYWFTRRKRIYQYCKETLATDTC